MVIPECDKIDKKILVSGLINLVTKKKKTEEQDEDSTDDKKPQ